MKQNETAAGATLSESQAPIYPEGVLKACPPPVMIQAQIVVDEVGKVSSIRFGENEQASGQKREFIDAVRGVVERWHFHPLEIDLWNTDSQGQRTIVDEVTRPFSLVYQFQFICKAGKADVLTVSSPAKT